MGKAFAAFDNFTRSLLYWLTISLFCVLAALMGLNVFLRVMNDFSFHIPMSMHWFDEIVEMCFSALIFYGSAALWAECGHFCVGDWISPHLPAGWVRKGYQLLVTLLSVAFLAVFFVYSLQLTMRATELTTVFQIPKSVLYSCMPVSSLIMLAYSIRDAVCLVK